MQTGTALAEAESLVSAALHLAHNENPKGQQKYEGYSVDQNGNEVSGTGFVDVDIDVLCAKLVIQVGIVQRNLCDELRAVSIVTLDIMAADADLANLALFHL